MTTLSNMSPLSTMSTDHVAGDFDDLSIAQPGAPRTIADLDLTVIEDAVSAEDGDSAAAAAALLGKEIAIKLSEPKVRADMLFCRGAP